MAPLEEVSVHSVLGLDTSDDGFDDGPPLHLALDGLVTRRTCPDTKELAGRSVQRNLNQSKLSPVRLGRAFQVDPPQRSQTAWLAVSDNDESGFG